MESSFTFTPPWAKYDNQRTFFPRNFASEFIDFQLPRMAYMSEFYVTESKKYDNVYAMEVFLAA